ncbi:MAG: diaminopimelate decarboxylase [Candidatus Nanopelagicales bacterium]|nr:diaminopimelate decarboxylase [Candidatus Nanopelagicales bacterium]MCF8537750.1 diaminopimelate decarboxylase [Candidatus Nanopelagicales bacterium]MCF8543040.1 diaminopimelate decarboxylase [Candidatus Nanopelagicales bacterium]MCF8558155.1 diaminopimelate decarboxylase [Candidatus Nanopelagicales bacterium]
MRAHPAGPRHADVVTDHGTLARPIDPTAMNHLAAPVWPASTHRTADGSLSIGGVDVRDVAAEYATPVFLIDEEDLRRRAREYRAAYLDSGARIVYYAAKAFLTTAVARWVTEEGLGIDVASGGELAVALRAGVSGDRLLMHGNNKSVSEIDAAVAAGVGRIVVDSFEDIVRIADAAAQAGVVQSVLVRVTLGVEAHTHEFIATAHEDQKFGLSVASGAAEEAVRRIAKLPSLDFRGLHSHIGSQIFDASGFEVAASRVVSLAQRIWDEQGIEVEELNLGGGMGIAYLESDDPLSVPDMALQIGDVVGKQCAQEGIPMPALAFEPGRAIVGPSTVTLYEVGTVKRVDLDGGAARTYVSVDGGMSDNIRTALYDAEYTVTLASRESTADPTLCRVVGKHCESGDIVVRDAWLPSDLAPGDLLAVAATGAYCRAMASNYNLLPRPGVVSARDGATAIVLRRETMDDLLSLDPGA